MSVFFVYFAVDISKILILEYFLNLRGEQLKNISVVKLL